MVTFVLSDLHIAVDAPDSLHAGGSILLHFLQRCLELRRPVRILFNGDMFDFLNEEGPLSLHEERAASAMQKIAGTQFVSTLLSQLGLLLAERSEITIRIGNHDLELALPSVQAVIRAALRQPSEIAQRLQFQLGDKPYVFSIGTRRVLVTHGEHDDPFNQVNYSSLTSHITGQGGEQRPFQYPAGSLLVNKIVAPLRRKYGLAFLDFLKPDFQGAVLCALAVAPQAVRELFQQASLDIGWQLLRAATSSVSFASSEGHEEDLGLATRLDAAHLDRSDRNELETWIHDDDSAVSFAPSALSESLRTRLCRAGMMLYAAGHRALAAKAGADYFQLDPSEEEMKWAAALARSQQVDVVLTGHTHAARFWQGDDCL